MKLIINNATKLTILELDAVRAAFKHAVKHKVPLGGKRYYTAGIDFPHCCDVLISRGQTLGNYIAEVN